MSNEPLKFPLNESVYQIEKHLIDLWLDFCQEVIVPLKNGVKLSREKLKELIEIGTDYKVKFENYFYNLPLNLRKHYEKSFNVIKLTLKIANEHKRRKGWLI